MGSIVSVEKSGVLKTAKTFLIKKIDRNHGRQGLQKSIK